MKSHLYSEFCQRRSDRRQRRNDRRLTKWVAGIMGVVMFYIGFQTTLLVVSVAHYQF